MSGRGGGVMGRPTKFTAATRRRILAALRAGLTYERAALAAGVHAETLRLWRRQAEEAEAGGDESSLFSGFFGELRRAEAEGERQAAEIVMQAARGGTKTVETKTTVVVRGEEIVESTTTTTATTTLPDWRAAMAMLERRHPERWARTDRHEHSGPGGGAILIDGPTLEQSARELTEWRKGQIDALSSGPIAALMQAISPISTE